MWQSVDREAQRVRRAAGISSYAPGPLPPSAAKSDLIGRYKPVADDGIAHFRRAIELHPQFADAMTFLSLLIRARADLQDPGDQYRLEIAEADEWVSRSFKARQAENSTATQRGPFLAPGNLQQAILIRKVDPTCPSETNLKLSGVVEFTITVGKGGEVDNIRVVSGDPLLVPPALDAVKQWLYRPTIGNDELFAVILPVELEMHCGGQ